MIGFSPGSNCTWCGHAWPHPARCPGWIVTGRKTEDRRECPCKRGE